jgi:hypothetical protein
MLSFFQLYFSIALPLLTILSQKLDLAVTMKAPVSVEHTYPTVGTRAVDTGVAASRGQELPLLRRRLWGGGGDVGGLKGTVPSLEPILTLTVIIIPNILALPTVETR